jgi:ParB family chromosome partitioning protein
MQLVENLQRDDLTPLERAQAIGALRDAHSLSIRDIADKLSISKSAVQRSLEILQLPDDLLNALKEGAAESKVLLLAKIDDPAIRASYLNDLDVLTRSELERNLKAPKPAPANSDDGAGKVVSAEDMRIADEIQRSLGMKVKLSRSSADADGGRLTIDFYGDSDLQIIFRKLVAEG